MKNKIDPKILTAGILIAVLLYCGFRSLGSMASASSHLSQTEGGQNPGTIERLLRDLDRTMSTEVDTSLACQVARDPFTAVAEKKKALAPAPAKKTTYKAPRSTARLTGLILDQNPVAIVEIGDKSLEVRVGSTLDGHKVIGIDERGVHILKNGNVVIIN